MIYMCVCRREFLQNRPVRTCGICSIQQGIRAIADAINDIENGLNEIRRCDFCGGVRRIEEAICDLERGVRDLREGLNNTEFRIRCRRRRELEEAICDIEACIRDIDRALNAICRGDIAVGTSTIEECLDDLNENFRELQDIIGFNELCNPNDNCMCNQFNR